VPFCPYCGSATVPDGQFCPNCGRQLPTKAGNADSGSPDGRGEVSRSPGSETPPPELADASDRTGPDEESVSGAVETGTGEFAAARSSLPPEFTPPVLETSLPSSFNPSDLPGTHPDWKMSPAEPYVPQRQRPRWLLIVAAVLGACLLVCVALVVFVNTPPGQQFLANQATHAARAATPVPGAVVGTPVP